MLVHHLLEHSARTRPGALAILHRDERTSFSDLDRGANRVARGLIAAGIRSGDRVGLLAENSRAYVESFFGVLKAGAVVVPLNTAADARVLGRMLADCTSRGLVACGRYAELAARIPGLPPGFVVAIARDEDAAHFRGRAVAAVVLEAVGQDTDGRLPDAPRPDQDRAAIIYTSGSTGHPKGAILRHANIVANVRSIVTYLELSPADRMLVVLPFFYVYGQSLLTTHVAVGASLAIENRFLFPSVVVDALERTEATGFAGVPSTFSILLHKTAFAKRRFPALRYVTQAGGAMAPTLTRELIHALPGKRIFVMYGATEASARLSYLPPEALSSHVGSIGRAIPGVELRILGENGLEVAPGEVGEIVARGPNIMEGYWGDPEETARVLDEDGYHTGDLARRDDEGFFWIVGRKRDMLKVGSHRISPKEIEEVLLEHPALLEAAVLGVPDDVLGEAIEAHVVARPQATIDVDELASFARERLPDYKVPRRFIVRPDLPKSAAGKILKESLRAAPEGC